MYVSIKYELFIVNQRSKPYRLKHKRGNRTILLLLVKTFGQLVLTEKKFMIYYIHH
mgnify:CR=1 FL=1